MEMKVSESVADNSVGRRVAIPPIGNYWGTISRRGNNSSGAGRVD
jgi:hypothetical protein